MFKRTDLHKIFKSIPLFQYFTDNAIDALLDFGTISYFTPEAYICKANEVEETVHVLLSGDVDLLLNQKGKDVYLASFGAGDIVGETGIFYKVGRTVTVQAKTEVAALTINRNMLFEFIKTFPTFGVQFLMIVIYSLTKKIKAINHDLAYERHEDLDQDAIDSMVREMMHDVNESLNH